jgi:hypothetical protein
LENIPAIFVSGEWHQILRFNALNLFACTITITLLKISTRYTQIYENLIVVSRYGTVVKVPIQAKMDVDDEDLTCFHFGSNQEPS